MWRTPNGHRAAAWQAASAAISSDQLELDGLVHVAQWAYRFKRKDPTMAVVGNKYVKKINSETSQLGAGVR